MMMEVAYSQELNNAVNRGANYPDSSGRSSAKEIDVDGVARVGRTRVTIDTVVAALLSTFRIPSYTVQTIQLYWLRRLNKIGYC
jgi:hypothetical protein